MEIISITIYLFLFTFITLCRFHYGLFLLFLLLPTYLIRFNIGPLPTTLLEVMIWIILINWILKYRSSIITNLKSQILNHKSLFIASFLFLLAATISIFTSLDVRAAAGEWKAIYIEPFLVFLVLITTFKKNQKIKRSKDQNNKQDLTILRSSDLIILLPLILCGLATSILSIIQHFTGWMVPWDFWENRNTFRVTGWYGYPNAVGLFLAPLVPLAVYLVKQSWNSLKKKTIKDQRSTIIYHIIFFSSLLVVGCSFLAIFYSKGTGPLIGVAAGIGVLLLAYKKTRWPAIILGLVGLVGILILPNTNPIKQELLMQDRSGQIRIAMWGEATALLSDRPILGAGLRSYAERIIPYHTTVNGEGIEIFHLPHNLFLSIWVNLGLLGILGFLWIVVWFFREALFPVGYYFYKEKKRFTALTPYLIASMTIILVTGLVDTPYIKNDLAILFWLLIVLLLIQSYGKKLENSKT